MGLKGFFGAYAAVLAVWGTALAESNAPMMRGLGDWQVRTLFTVSESIGDYRPPGLLDGIGAFAGPSEGVVRVLVNHELVESKAYRYELANGTALTGARVSFFDLDRATRKPIRAGIAYDSVFDRRGAQVTDALQVNEDGEGRDGFSRFCSGRAIAAGEFGMEDDVYFVGEESADPRFHPHGGTEWVIDVRGRAIWAIPAMGRGAWENVAPVTSGDPRKVAFLLGDDSEAAPLYLYVGDKHAVGDGSFLDRNGLVRGKLYYWAADEDPTSPNDFSGATGTTGSNAGFGATLRGRFKEIAVRDPSRAGEPGFDALAYKDGSTLRTEASAGGGFQFSRPEDLHENPRDPSVAAFASTGGRTRFPRDTWGTVYLVAVDVSELAATVTILHDADDLSEPDSGVRNPDNLTWSPNGKIYVQEDRSTAFFGLMSEEESSVWEIDPDTGVFRRIAHVDRSVVVPEGTTDTFAGEIGAWESSGILDVTALFDTVPAETLLIATVQAHGIRDGAIGGDDRLAEGGQLVLLSGGVWDGKAR